MFIAVRGAAEWRDRRNTNRPLGPYVRFMWEYYKMCIDYEKEKSRLSENFTFFPARTRVDFV
jgi:hypothetical protein